MGFPSVQQSSETVAASYLPSTHDALGPAVGSIVGFCSFAIVTIGMLLISSVLGAQLPQLHQQRGQHITGQCAAAAQRVLSCMGCKGLACTCRVDVLASPEAASQGQDGRRQGRSHVAAALPANLPDLRGHARCARPGLPARTRQQVIML